MFFKRKILFLFSLLGLLILPFYPEISAQVNVSAFVSPGITACQDGIDNDEDGKIDYPQDSGCASLNDNDEYNSGVINPPLGGGGGGGAVPLADAKASVTFKGTAYPGSRVFLLKDGVLSANTYAGDNGKFDLNFSNLSSSNYVFGIGAEDYNGVRSVVRTYTISLNSGLTTVIEGIFIPPTISTDLAEVKKGDLITFLGQTTPGAQIQLSVNSNNKFIATIDSKNDGAWVYKLDTTKFEDGDHSASSRSILGGDISSYSNLAFFKIGDKNIPTKKSTSFSKVDLNADKKIDLVDFSVLVYWFKRPILPSVHGKVDLNNDGNVDLVDFSIMAYYWTG